MKKREIEKLLQDNILIHKFMGWKDASLEYKIKWVNCHTEERLNRLDPQYIPDFVNENSTEPMFKDWLDYDSNWSTLMPVRDKLIELGYDIHISKKAFIVSTEKGHICGEHMFLTTVSEEEIFEKRKLTQKEMMFRGIVRTITIHNSKVIELSEKLKQLK